MSELSVKFDVAETVLMLYFGFRERPCVGGVNQGCNSYLHTRLPQNGAFARLEKVRLYFESRYGALASFSLPRAGHATGSPIVAYCVASPTAP